MRLSRLLAFFLLSCTLPALAAPVKEKLPDGLPVSAEFRPPATGKPVVLLVHGFLQTRDHSTVAQLGNGIADLGFGVLLPTLSLRIPNRAQSLSCEAIHQHSMDDDIAEIAFWIAWLKRNGYSDIILGGHSSGALQSLAYAASKPDKSVRKLILISIPDPARNMTKVRTDEVPLDLLQKRQAAGDRSLLSQHLWFCGKYRSPLPAYVSYVQWTRERTLQAFSKERLPTVIIVGENDNLINADWAKEIKSTGHTVHAVKNANHFFEDASEFDLLELTQSLIRQ